MGDLLSTKAGVDTSACTGPPSAAALARWQKTKEIFGLVLDSEAGKRAGLLRELCDGDESMMAEVSSLLARQAAAVRRLLKYSRQFHLQQNL